MGHRPAVEGGGCRRTGDGQGEPAAGPDGEATEQHLERRAVLGVADEAGPEPVGGAVGRSGAAHPDGGEAGAAGVLDEHERAGGQHLEGAHVGASASTKRTVVPGPSRAGGSRSTSNSTAAVVPTSCQPPGDDRGYTPENSPASPTDPAGTDGRGRSRRGTRRRGSPPTR